MTRSFTAVLGNSQRLDGGAMYGNAPRAVWERWSPPDERHRIFDARARSDRDVDRAARTSHGLGLAFCRMAVAAHGGELWVEDNVPHGSVFCVRLPRRQAAPASG